MGTVVYNIYTNNNAKQYQPGGQYIPTGYGGHLEYDTGGWSTGPSILNMSTGSTSASAFDVSAYSGTPYGYSTGSNDTLTGLPSSLIAYGAQKARQINDQLGLSTMFANLHSILTMPFIPSSETGNYGNKSYTGASGSSGHSGSSSSSSSSASSGSSDSSGSSGSAGSTGSSGSSSSSGSTGSTASQLK